MAGNSRTRLLNFGRRPHLDHRQIACHRQDIEYFSSMSSPSFARALRKKSTWAEKLLWAWLRDRRFTSYKFRRQHPVGPFYLDFFCAEAKLSIELDGGGHGHPAQRAHDAERTQFLATLGIKELRFSNWRLRRDRQVVRDTIFREVQARAPHPLPDYTRPIASPGGS